MAPTNTWFGKLISACFLGLLCLLFLGMGQKGADKKTQKALPKGSESTSDWPHYRGGAKQQGHAPGVLGESLHPLWRIETQGPLHSSAVIRNGRVYVGSNGGNIYALSLKTGQTLWTFQTQGPVEASPTLLDTSLVVGSTDGSLYSLSLKDGKLLWRYETEGKILGAATRLRTPSGTRVVAVGSYDGQLHAVNERTGKALWTYETQNFLHGSPGIWKGNLVAGGCDSHVHVVSPKGTLVKKIPVGAQVGASPLIHGNLAFVGSYGNRFMEIDLSNGQVSWEYSNKGFPFFSSAAMARNTLFVGGRDRRIHAINQEDGKALWTFPTQGKVDGSPVLCDGKLLAGSYDGRLYMLNHKDGKQLWSFDLGAPILATPAVSDAMVVIGAIDGSLHAFGPKPSNPTQKTNPKK